MENHRNFQDIMGIWFWKLGFYQLTYPMLPPNQLDPAMWSTRWHGGFPCHWELDLAQLSLANCRHSQGIPSTSIPKILHQIHQYLNRKCVIMIDQYWSCVYIWYQLIKFYTRTKIISCIVSLHIFHWYFQRSRHEIPTWFSGMFWVLKPDWP